MSELRFASLTMPATALGPENPLPALAPLQMHPPVQISDTIPESDRKHFGFGMGRTCLPYRLQDNYDRHRTPRTFRTAVLENEHLKATFLLEAGGRLWSLMHKGSGTELLEVNPVFQLTNLALRNAWFSGGVEWNAGVPGHSAFGLMPLFTATLAGPGGCPVLRLYEFDRGQAMPFQIDFWLPDGSPVLLVRPRIINPHDQTIPMWWWSNIAVPEHDGGRVLAPAPSADAHDYDEGKRHLLRRKLPLSRGVDVTYPRHYDHSGDLYFRIPKGQRPWSFAADAGGRGLIHISTPRLQGRKLFFWGMGGGGKRWQEYLSIPGRRYLEIQGGLAPTQAECIPMPAHADWSWLEAYGLMEGDAKTVHGPDWDAAWRHIDARAERLIATADLNRLYDESAALAEMPPREIVIQGAGWGALENRRLAKAGQAPMSRPSTPFPEQLLGPEQQPWLTLLDTGCLPEHPVTQAPPSYMVQTDWQPLLEASLVAPRGNHWAAWLQAGVMHQYHGRMAQAKAAWEKSLALARSGWALRNLAVLAVQEDQKDRAADLYVEAVKLLPEVTRLSTEGLTALVNAQRPEAAMRFIDRLSPAIKAHPRVDFMRARAQSQLGQLDAADAYLASNPEIPDMREGELTLSEFWFEVKARQLAAAAGRELSEEFMDRARREFPVPPRIDFRQRVLPAKAPPSKPAPHAKPVKA